MKALVLNEVKQPLVLETRDDLQPAAGQVVVQLRSAALNRRAYAYDTSHNGQQDVYLMIIDPALPPGYQIEASTFLGGKSDEGAGNTPPNWDYLDVAVESG
ncbi:MAG: hypothetical protein AAF497_05990, partial [Planctomycetota bacterium]